MPNISLNDDIAAVKEIILKQIFNGNQFLLSNDNSYQKIFAKTNEHIDNYFKADPLLDKKNALSVLAGGDQIFTLIYSGIKDISSFDINRLTYYYTLGIKRAAILKYKYEPYLDFINNLSSDKFPLDELTDLVKGLFPNMEEDCVSFWQEILEYNYEIQKRFETNINLFSMLLFQFPRFYTNPPYIKVKDAYDKCRSQLGNANITFENTNCLDLSRKMKEKYDVILLSNIFDYFYKYWNYDWIVDKLLEFSNGLKPLLNDNGIIFLDYILLLKKSSKYIDPLIKKSDVSIEDLKKYFEVF